jgi:hypothetical protein
MEFGTRMHLSHIIIKKYHIYPFHYKVSKPLNTFFYINYALSNKLNMSGFMVVSESLPTPPPSILTIDGETVNFILQPFYLCL